MINHIYSNVGFKKVIDLYKLIEYLDKNPEIAKINKDMKLNQISKVTKEKIDRLYRQKEREIKVIKQKLLG